MSFLSQVNETWTADCHECECKESGLECKKMECMIKCPPGTQLSKTKCCECEPIDACMHNGKPYPEGRVIIDFKTCQEKTCEAGAQQSTLEWKDRPISCDMYCKGNTTSQDMDNCCKCNKTETTTPAPPTTLAVTTPEGGFFGGNC